MLCRGGSYASPAILFWKRVIFAPEGGINPSPTVGSPKKRRGAILPPIFSRGKLENYRRMKNKPLHLQNTVVE